VSDVLNAVKKLIPRKIERIPAANERILTL